MVSRILLQAPKLFGELCMTGKIFIAILLVDTGVINFSHVESMCWICDYCWNSWAVLLPYEWMQKLVHMYNVNIWFLV